MITFLAISDNKCCHGNTFSCFLGFTVFWRVLSIPNRWHGLELVSFLMITGNKCAMATLFSVSWTYKYFMGSLLSISQKTNQLQL